MSCMYDDVDDESLKGCYDDDDDGDDVGCSDPRLISSFHSKLNRMIVDGTSRILQVRFRLSFSFVSESNFPSISFKIHFFLCFRPCLHFASFHLILSVRLCLSLHFYYVQSVFWLFASLAWFGC